MTEAKLTLDIKNIPELIYDLRHEFATMLREEADSEGDPRFARKLRELAADYEVGRATI